MKRVQKLLAARNYIHLRLGLLAPIVLIVSLMSLFVASTLSVRGSIRSPQNDPKLQTFRGDAAKLRVYQVREKNKALVRVMSDLEKKGRRPSWDNSFTVMSVTGATVGQANPRKSLPVSYAQDGSYEMTFITYSESAGQWEGVIYINNPYENDTYYAVVTTPASGWDVPYEVYYPPDGGDPTCGGGYCEILGAGRKGPERVISYKPVSARSSTGRTSAPTLPAGFWGRIKRWAQCVNDTCWWARQCGGFWCTVSGCAQAIFRC